MIQVKKPFQPHLSWLSQLDKREESATIVPRVRPAHLDAAAANLEAPLPPEE
jgi:hypothetical protein